MTLAALAPWEPAGGATLRSALEHRFRDAGATFEQRGAWRVATTVAGEAARVGRAGFADASHLGKLELRGGDAPADAPGRHVLRVAPGRWIVLCAFDARPELATELGAGRDLVVDMSGAWSLLLLGGTEAERLLRRLGPIAELPGGGPVAGVPARAFRRGGLIWFLTGVEHAQHVYDVCADLSAPLGGGPAGFDALVADAADDLLGLPQLELGR